MIGAYFGGSWIQFPVGSFLWLLSEANDWRNKGAWTTRKSLQTIYRRTFVSCSEKIKTIKSLCISCTDTPHHYSHPNLDVMRNRILGQEDECPLATLSTSKAKTSCPTLVKTREKPYDIHKRNKKTATPSQDVHHFHSTYIMPHDAAIWHMSNHMTPEIRTYN